MKFILLTLLNCTTEPCGITYPKYYLRTDKIVALTPMYYWSPQKVNNPYCSISLSGVKENLTVVQKCSDILNDLTDQKN